MKLRIRLWGKTEHCVKQCAKKLNIHLVSIWKRPDDQNGGYFGYGNTREDFPLDKDENKIC